ncbi:hypothetical protein B0H17DRAFT_1105471 [Mycena rosella]|uniref:Uncharacterized protein n=1 Tax=Mycena rosella TaxID=1033263 RepID=A0AAD7C6D2_MYCRO|nr:hypothetical protein B0H17DRAFT_1105471 [Mycena rosella]
MPLSSQPIPPPSFTAQKPPRLPPYTIHTCQSLPRSMHCNTCACLVPSSPHDPSFDLNTGFSTYLSCIMISCPSSASVATGPLRTLHNAHSEHSNLGKRFRTSELQNQGHLSFKPYQAHISPVSFIPFPLLAAFIAHQV